MTELFPFLVAGLVTGSVYGLAATGLVLSYRTSGIFNFAHGAIAALGAYCFYQLRQEWGLPWPIAGVLTLVLAGVVVGYAMERLARALDGASTASKIVATVGVLTATSGILTAIYGGATRSADTFLPTRVWTFGNVSVGVDQVIIFVIAVGASLGLAQYLRRSAAGTRMRAVVDDSDLLDLAGTDPVRVRRFSWVIGAAFAALSGVLLAPTIGLDPNLLTLLVIQAFGAAAIGRFSSLRLTLVGGLLVGLAGSLSSKYVGDYRILAGFPASVPFILLFAVLVFSRQGRFVKLGTVAQRVKTRPPSLPAKFRLSGAAALAAVAAAVPAFAGPRLPVYSTALIYVLVFASLRLLVVTSGQVSLCHVAFLAVGATSFAHMAGGTGVPWLVALLLAGLVAVPVGAIVAIPAIRLSGVYLALATFGFGILVERFVYPMGIMFGKTGQAQAPRPAIGIFDATSPKGFYYVALLIVAVGIAAIHLFSNSRLGRLLRGLADSPVGLSTLGTSVNITRVIVFCVSAFFAGLAGALFAAFSGTFNGVSLPSLLSLTLLVVLAIAGRGELLAPVLAATFLTIVPSYITGATFNEYLPVFFGVAAVATATLSNPRLDAGSRLHEVTDRCAARRRVSRIGIRAGRVPADPSPAVEAGGGR